MVRMVQLLLRKLHLEADWIKRFLYFNATLKKKKKKTNLNGGQSNKALNELMWLQYQNYSCSSGCHRISTATIMSQTSHRYKACLKKTKQYWKVDLIRWIYGPNTTIHNKKKEMTQGTVDTVFSFQEWHREWCQHISTGDWVTYQRTADPSCRSTHCQHVPNMVHTSTGSPQAGDPLFYFNQYGNYSTFHTIFLHCEYNLLLTVLKRKAMRASCPLKCKR